MVDCSWSSQEAAQHQDQDRHLYAMGRFSTLLGGSGVVKIGVIRRVTLLITLLITTHEPPSKGLQAQKLRYLLASILSHPTKRRNCWSLRGSLSISKPQTQPQTPAQVVKHLGTSLAMIQIVPRVGIQTCRMSHIPHPQRS